MALKMVLDSLEGVPEDVAKEYVERDGKFHVQVEGMKTQADIDRVQTSLTAARTEVKGYKDKLALLGDRKVEDVVVLLDRIPELEAAAGGKLDETKLNELVEGRIKTRLAPLERQVTQLTATVAEKDGIITDLTGKERTRTLSDHIREAAKEVNMLPEAVEDALMLGLTTLQLTDDGRPVVKEGLAGAGLAPKDWLTDLQTKKPHWWGASQGGGAGGNRTGGAGGGVNPWTAEGWNMTEQGKILTADRTRADSLAKAAGTTIGGPKPAPKK